MCSRPASTWEMRIWVVAYIVWCMQYLQMMFCYVAQQNGPTHLWVSVAAVGLALVLAVTGSYSGVAVAVVVAVATVETAFAGATAVEVVFVVLWRWLWLHQWLSLLLLHQWLSLLWLYWWLALLWLSLLNMGIQLGLRLKWQGNYGGVTSIKAGERGFGCCLIGSMAWLGTAWQMNWSNNLANFWRQ